MNNNNVNSLKENYNKIIAKRLVGLTKGNVWKSNRRNKAI